METIKNYLEMMFAPLPDTPEVRKIKEDLLSDMEEKYSELKGEGKSENEAVGTVISEFGNIDELMKEFGFGECAGRQPVDSAVQIKEKQDVKCLEEVKVREIISQMKRCTGYLLAGFWLCILSPVVFMVFEQKTQSDTLMSLPMFLMIAAAVALFIKARNISSKYVFLKSEIISLPFRTVEMLQKEKESFHNVYMFSVAAGVILFILSPIMYMACDEFISGPDGDIAGTLGMLLFAGTGISLFLAAGGKNRLYEKLLQEGSYQVQFKLDKAVKIVDSVLWSVLTAVYLVWSLTTGRWDITWIIWPAAAFLFWIYKQVISIIRK